MLQEIINGVTPILVTAIVGVLSVVIKKVGDSAIDFIESKKKLIEANTKKEDRQMIYSIATSVWHIVEEHYRLSDAIGNVTDRKIEMFNKLLLQKVPNLKQSDIDQIRQAIAGEINKGKQILLTDEKLTELNSKLQDENIKLTTENEELKNKLNNIQNLANK